MGKLCESSRLGRADPFAEPSMYICFASQRDAEALLYKRKHTLPKNYHHRNDRRETKSNQQIFSTNHRGSTTWKDSQKHVSNGIASLLDKTLSRVQLAETPCMDDHQLSPEDFNRTGELAPTCAQILLTCLYSVRIGRRSVTKWNKVL